MTIVNLQDGRNELAQMVDRVLQGEEIILAKAGDPVAILIPYKKEIKRRGGGLEGVIKIAEDFDDPLPESVLQEFFK